MGLVEYFVGEEICLRKVFIGNWEMVNQPTLFPHNLKLKRLMIIQLL